MGLNYSLAQLSQLLAPGFSWPQFTPLIPCWGPSRDLQGAWGFLELRCSSLLYAELLCEMSCGCT